MLSLVNLNSILLVTLLSSALWEVRTIAAAADTDGVFDGPKIRVDIFNELPDDYPFTIHCKSKDDDLGTVWVGPGQNYGFGFRVNFWGTTLFFCRASWHGGSAEFDIFRAGRDDLHRCSTSCRWAARRDAVVGLKGNTREADIVIPWKPK